MGHLALPLGVVSYTPPLACMAVGVVFALAGHITQFRRVVAFGLALIFIGTAISLLTAYRDYVQHGSPPTPAATNPFDQTTTR